MKTVLVLFGGRSAEHEISLLSARFVVDSLDRSSLLPLLCGIDKSGRWHLLREEDLPDTRDPRQCIDERAVSAWMLPIPAPSGTRPLLYIDGEPPRPFDVAFPVLHGPYGEDGCLQGLFELACVPYVGSGVAASALGMNKLLQKRIFQQAELPLLRYVAFDEHAYRRAPEAQRAACAALGFPLFVKPANMGSSLGVSRVAGQDGLFAAIELALELDTTVIVEQGLDGAREIELSVLGNEEVQVSEPGEIVVTHRDGFYSYDAKYLDAHGADLCVAPELPATQKLSLQILAEKAYRALGCEGMARVDMFLSGDEVYLNELNTIPGFTAISMFPRLWHQSGIDGRKLVSRLIELACERHARRMLLKTSHPGAIRIR